VKATKEPGKIGAAARHVAELLHPHCLKEVEFALTPLGMLAPWAAGRVTPNMEELLKMSGRMKAELPQMVREHHEIVRTLSSERWQILRRARANRSTPDSPRS
jgi:hypothetical protein